MEIGFVTGGLQLLHLHCFFSVEVELQVELPPEVFHTGHFVNHQLSTHIPFMYLFSNSLLQFLPIGSFQRVQYLFSQ